MTYLRTLATIILMTISFATAPITEAPQGTGSKRNDVVLTAEITPIQQIPELPDTDIIKGVRVVDGTTEHTDRIESALQTFTDAGWPLTNVEIRVGGEDGCGGHAGVHSVSKGHDVVEICTDAPFVLLHELGHVWSDRYLDDDKRAEWLQLRGLSSWSDADYHERGTEQAADIIAFGLLDTWVTPTRIAPNDWKSLIESFTWLFNMEPVHMGGTSVTVPAAPETANTETGTPSTVRASFTPDTEGTFDTVVSDTTPTAGYRFPMACGFPCWHSRNGGYGYEDARDWTHLGVDLYAYEGTPVVAPVNGLVTASGYGESAGWNVRIEDATGRVHVMMHFENRPLTVAGDRVRAGQEIATVGRTGNAAGGGPHIHYEIRNSDDTIDPMPWLRATGSTFVGPAASDLYSGRVPAFSSCDSRA
jgi:hypothetical protein